MGNSNTKNDKFVRIIRIAIPIVLVVAGVIYGFGKLNSRVEAVEAEVKKAEETRERLIRVEEGIEYLKKGVDEIKKELQNARK